MNKPVAELVLEQMAVGDASSLRVKWLTDSYPPVGTKLYTHPAEHDIGIAEAIGFEKGHKSASNMLREQQAEILAGKIMIKGYSKIIDVQQAKNNALKERLAYLEAQVYGGPTK